MKAFKMMMVLITMFAPMNVLAQRAGQSAAVSIGVVEDLKQIDLSRNNTGKGVAAGTAVGALRSSNNRGRSVVTGAVVGGAVGRATSTNKMGMQYIVRTGPNSVITVVSDQVEIRKGDCVSVQQSGDKAMVTRISTEKCAAVTAAAQTKSSAPSGNDACEQAKQELAAATTKEALNLAKQKINVLCK